MKSSKLLSIYFVICVFLTTLSSLSYASNTIDYPGPYSGFRILGGNNVSAAYSFSRGNSGIQHYFINDFNNDLISGCYPQYKVDTGSNFESLATVNDISNTVGSFFVNSKYQSKLSSDLNFEYNIYSTKLGIIVYDIKITNTSNVDHTLSFSPYFSSSMPYSTALINLPNNSGNSVSYSFSSTNTKIFTYFKQGTTFLPLFQTGNSYITSNIPVPANDTTEIFFAIAGGGALPSYYANLEFTNATQDWNTWFNSSSFGAVEFIDSNIETAYYAALMGVAGTELGGIVPAGITGQFVTYGLPQIYPRDAMMCTRAFINSGNCYLAKNVMNYWLSDSLAFYNGGAWYARYDSKGEAVNSGTGAPYNVPEYDSNAYYTINFVDYYLASGEWPVDNFTSSSPAYALIKKLNDFIVSQMNANNLVSDGGIVEIGGSILPSTNMTLVAGLKDAALIAYLTGDTANGQKYKDNADNIFNAIGANLFDKSINTYMDIRSDGSRYYNVSTLFGFLYGYNDNGNMSSSFNYYIANNQPKTGGFQYFGDPYSPYDPAHPSGGYCYGNSIFGFTTGAAAEYSAITGENPDIFKNSIIWMMNNSNIYGQMPEHIWFPYYNSVSDESPLTWADAEFANAVLIGAETGNSLITSDYEYGLNKIMTKYNNLISINNTLANEYGIETQEAFTKTGTDVVANIEELQSTISNLYDFYNSNGSTSPVTDQTRIYSLLADRLFRIKQIVDQLELNSSDNLLEKETSRDNLRFEVVVIYLKYIYSQILNF